MDLEKTCARSTKLREAERMLAMSVSFNCGWTSQVSGFQGLQSCVLECWKGPTRAAKALFASFGMLEHQLGREVQCLMLDAQDSRKKEMQIPTASMSSLLTVNWTTGFSVRHQVLLLAGSMDGLRVPFIKGFHDAPRFPAWGPTDAPGRHADRYRCGFTHVPESLYLRLRREKERERESNKITRKQRIQKNIFIVYNYC